MNQKMYKVRTDNILFCQLISQGDKSNICELGVNGRGPLDINYTITIRLEVDVFDSIFDRFISDVTEGAVHYQITGLLDNVKITEEGMRGICGHIYVISAPVLSDTHKYQIRLEEDVFDAIFMEIAPSDMIRTTLIDLFKTIGGIDTLSNADLACIDALSSNLQKYLESGSLHLDRSDGDNSVHDIHWAIDQYLAGKRVRIANWVTGKYLVPLSVLSLPDAHSRLQPLMKNECDATNWEVCE